LFVNATPKLVQKFLQTDVVKEKKKKNCEFLEESSRFGAESLSTAGNFFELFPTKPGIFFWTV
jgi:hypothetical protein